MPRRNKHPIVKRVLAAQSPEISKVRYPSKQAALSAANDRMRYHLELELSVYQSPQDGGWYLTSKPAA